MENDYRPQSKGFGFVEFETDEADMPKVEQARPKEDSERLRSQRRIGTEAIDQTNKGEK